MFYIPEPVRGRAGATKSRPQRPGTRRPTPTRHPGESQDQSRKRHPLRLWILGRAQDDGRGGRSVPPAINRRSGSASSHAPTRTRNYAQPRRPPTHSPSSWRKPGSRAANATLRGSGSWVEPRMTAGAGAVCLQPSIVGPDRQAHTRQPAPATTLNRGAPQPTPRHPGESQDPEPQTQPCAALDPGSSPG